MKRWPVDACILVFCSALAGISLAGDSPEVAAERSRLTLADAPDEPIGVAEAITQLKTESAQPGKLKSREVTIAGQIGGMPNPWGETHPDFPWFAGQGSFFLLDSKVAAQFSKHAKNHGGHHNCAFCQSLAAKNAHNVAVVNLVDENGEILKIDSRELLDLKENQRVVLRGQAELLGGTMLVIHADGVHIHR